MWEIISSFVLNFKDCSTSMMLSATCQQQLSHTASALNATFKEILSEFCNNIL